MAERFQDQLTKLKGSVSGVMMIIARALLPTLLSLAEKVTAVIAGVKAWMDRNPGLAKTLTAVTAA